MLGETDKRVGQGTEYADRLLFYLRSFWREDLEALTSQRIQHAKHLGMLLTSH